MKSRKSGHPWPKISLIDIINFLCQGQAGVSSLLPTGFSKFRVKLWRSFFIARRFFNGPTGADISDLMFFTRIRWEFCQIEGV